ncbi:hypothetical protein CBM2623_B140036 [Cupriavidus taiwanensis]|nr:hypothetical protein CBM2608_B130163 [Cupriavidus taiwanensis]SPA32230.1 hypothetical protein CBM2623_B140036 [Cupriavidus taiwanensis]
MTLQALADLARVSRFHFARMFKRSMGETPMAHVERVRLLRAREISARAIFRWRWWLRWWGSPTSLTWGGGSSGISAVPPASCCGAGTTPGDDALAQLPQLPQAPPAAMSCLCN